jgi:hypothetical protein
MNGRPLTVTIIGWVFIAASIIAIGYHATEIDPHALFAPELLWALFVRLLALLGGAFLLRGADWARWLLVVWMGYHVVLSAFHAWSGAAMHAAMLLALGMFLFRERESAYFRGSAGTAGP